VWVCTVTTRCGAGALSYVVVCENPHPANPVASNAGAAIVFAALVKLLKKFITISLLFICSMNRHIRKKVPERFF